MNGIHSQSRANDVLPLSGQRVVLTGAGRGIGKAMAIQLAACGAQLLCVSRTAAQLDETLGQCGPNATALVLDISTPNAAPQIIKTSIERLGGIDILVHSAGVMKTGSIENMALADFDELFAVNVRAPYALTQAALPALKAAQGQILFINSSIIRAANVAGRGGFAATQGALKALTDSIRDDVNPLNIRVVSIMPGTTATPRQEALFVESGRHYRPDLLLQASDVAQAAIGALQLPRTAEVTDLFVRPMRKS